MSTSTSLSPTPISTTFGDFTADRFNTHMAGLPPSAPAWWIERKRSAYAEFASLPMPARTDETWRFSSREHISLSGFNSSATGTHATSGTSGIEIGDAAARLTFVDGKLSGRTPLSRDLAASGIVVGTLLEGLTTHSELLRKHFMAQPQKLGSEKFAALHTAFIPDGAFIYVPRNVELKSPIVITHASTGAGSAVFPHTLVVAEENSRVTVVDVFVTLETGRADESADAKVVFDAFACGANDLYAAHGASINYAAAQLWSNRTLSFQLNSTLVRRDARVQSLNLHLGGKQARHESLSQLQAPGAFSEMLAVSVASSDQEFDQRTLQIHQAPNTRSDLLYKNALLDTARTIFSGLIVVDPDAQKTDAYQSNRNLMLSDNADASSLPGLEIQANDVRCTHGATTSRVDPSQLFYLESRGIPPAVARELLVFGFFEEVLNRLENESLHAVLIRLIELHFRRAWQSPAK
ncbi:MAG: Fe-S cluster assembly protein SufD [Opitutaceae bacterium]|nr:Fe-S cluster assembly protein SufD [Opitutaceae bacterium]